MPEYDDTVVNRTLDAGRYREQGVSVLGVSVQGVYVLGGSVRGVHVRGGGGLCPRTGLNTPSIS